MTPLVDWAEVVFVDPAMLWLLAVVPLVGLLRAFWPRLRSRAPAIKVDPLVIAHPGATLKTRLRWLPMALRLGGIVVAVLALARPVRREPLPERGEGIDIVLCIDVSSSMEAQDLEPERTRLEVVRRAATDFVGARTDDRIGLVVFAAYADILCPPTLDHQALEESLARVQLVEPDGPEDQTGIGNAIARSARMLRASTAASRVIVLLTDGEENVATAEKNRAVKAEVDATRERDRAMKAEELAEQRLTEVAQQRDAANKARQQS